MQSTGESWRKLYPFASHYMELDGGVRMHYVDEGSSGPEDKCIVAVHGNPTWSFYYRSIVEAMRGSHRVLAVDHIGCGLSDKPQKYPYCLATHTANLVRWIEKLDLRNIVMVVHDWGGAIGLGAAIECRDRIAGLVVLNTGAFPPPYVPLRIAACRIPILGSWGMTRLNLFARAATTMAIDRLPRLDDDVRDGLLAPYDTPEHRVGIDTFVRDIPLSKNHPTYGVLAKLESRLPDLSELPIHLVWGMKDWCFTPTCLRRFQAAWPGAVTQELSDVGHYVMEESPQDVIAHVGQLVSAS
jgi:haloalkane dehalogenase